MSDLMMWSLLVGAASPLAISVVQRPSWTSQIRVAIMAVFCLIVGAGTAYFTGQLTGRSVVSAVLVVLVTALATYHGIWQPTGIAPKLEVATTPGNRARVALTNATHLSAVEGAPTQAASGVGGTVSALSGRSGAQPPVNSAGDPSAGTTVVPPSGTAVPLGLDGSPEGGAVDAVVVLLVAILVVVVLIWAGVSIHAG
jgi:hypothetical protein